MDRTTQLLLCSRFLQHRERAHTYTHTHHCGSAFVNSSSLERCEEKEMATHSGVLACRIPGMGEPGGLPSMGSHRVGHD